MILVILTITIWEYDALKKVCAEIKWENQDGDEKKVPNFKLSIVDSIRDLILIFYLNLSIGSPYNQGGCIWTNFRLSNRFILRWYSWESRTSLTKHFAQNFCTGSDDPALVRMIRPNSEFRHWASPDDPALARMIWAWGFCERLVVPGRMIWPYTGWSGPGNSSVF